MLKEVIFPRFGVPRYLMTDGGSHFIHGAFSKMLAKYDVNHRIASPYHPQSSGQVELSNREIKLILQKTINRFRKNWSKKLDDALWAYRTAYKNPMGMSPYKMVYGKACHLPLELEHKAYWAIKELNYDFKLASEKRLFDISSLDEWRTQAYENAKLFKEKVKRWHDKRIQKHEFNVGDYVLLYNSRLMKVVNGQRIKHYISGNPINVETNIIETVTPEEYIRDTFQNVSDSEKE